MPPKPPRRSRFERPGEPDLVFRITLRDLEILRLVGEHRFLSSAHLHLWLGGSRQNLLRRLQRLFHHGYLDRPKTQLDYFHAGGSKPMVYGLGRRGAGRLRRDLDIPFSRLEWAGRPQSVGRQFLDHALMVSDALTALELACRKCGAWRLVLLDGLVCEPTRVSSRRAWQWSVSVAPGQRVGVVPDRVFALEPTTPDSQGERLVFFLEADRGTMPITRSSLRLSSVDRKLRAYEATWSRQIHESKLGISRFRVLTVTSSNDRTGHILEHIKSLPRGRGLFLCTDRSRLVTAADGFAAEIWEGMGGNEPLVPPINP